MARQTADDFAPEVLKLFDQYVHGGISRRGFLDGAGKYAVGGMTAVGLLEALSPELRAGAAGGAERRAHRRRRASNFDSPQGYGKASGYLVKPAQAPGRRHPGVLVVHENRGLNPHIEDIARRLALEGYLAFAPDALFPLGGYPGDEDKARDLFGKLDQAKVKADFLAAAQLLKTHAGTNGRVGAVGFCFGGGVVNFLATQWPDLNAGVPFYGVAPDLADVPRIRAPLMLHFAGNDERVNAHVAAVRGRAEGGAREVRGLRLPGRRARLQQRHHAALRRQGRRRWPGSARWRSSRRTCARRDAGCGAAAAALIRSSGALPIQHSRAARSAPRKRSAEAACDARAMASRAWRRGALARPRDRRSSCAPRGTEAATCDGVNHLDAGIAQLHDHDLSLPEPPAAWWPSRPCSPGRWRTPRAAPTTRTAWAPSGKAATSSPAPCC